MATDNELISIADLIVGLRDSATHACNVAAERKATIEQRDAEIASLNKKLAGEKQTLQSLAAEVEALRRGITVYRTVFTTNADVDPADGVDAWEASVGSIIWPRKLAATIAWPQQPWHDGEVPPVFLSVPGIEWEIERKSCDTPTAAGVVPSIPEVRCRPVNISWEDLCRAAAVILGNVHCMQGVARMEDAAVFETLGVDKASKASARVCVEYHKAYSEAVEFLRPAAVTVAAVKRADLEGFREHLKPRHEAPDGRPFRFVDPADRPISWTFLDPKMPASGAEPKAAAAEPPPQDSTVHPGAEFRQGLRPKIFEKLTGIVWDDQRTPRFASRPVNSTWAEVQRRAAEILGREDCLAGRERQTTAKGGIYDAVGMTHEDRAKTDAAAVAYQKAYSAEVAWVREDDVSYSAKITAQQRGAVKWINSSDPMSSFCFVDKTDGLPISWRALDPVMETKHTATAELRDRDPGPAGTIEIEVKRDSLEALIDGSEFRTKRAWSCLPPIPGLVWDHAKDSYEVRPVNMTWGEVHRLAAEILGEADAKAGKERMSKEMIYDALSLTDDDRAKTDVAEFAYNKAYSGAIPYLRPGRVSDKAAGEAKRRGAWAYRGQGNNNPLDPFIYTDAQSWPISWRVLDLDMDITPDYPRNSLESAPAGRALRIRGGTQALAVLLRIFADGPAFRKGNDDHCHIETLTEDGLIGLSSEGNYLATPGGLLKLDEDLKNLRKIIFHPFA